jgi:RNA polymerase sigma-70 factor (ECF subfamily)
VQTVLLKLQSRETLRRLRAARAPLGYLTTMLRSALVDQVRRNARDPVGLEGDYVDVDTRSPLAQMEDAREARRLYAALARLAPADRLLLDMRFWDGLSIGEMAEQMRLPYSTVAVRLFRIIRRLRRGGRFGLAQE